MCRSLEFSCGAAGVVSLPLFLLPAIWHVRSSYWDEESSYRITRKIVKLAWKAEDALPAAVSRLRHLVTMVMYSLSAVPSAPSSSKVVEWDLSFAEAARDFAVHEDIAAHCGDFCETRPLDAGRPELQSHLSALMQLPALNLFENKLYRHYYLARMGVPIPDLLYAGTVDPLAADLGLPVFNESALWEAALAALHDTGFVLKPLNCEGSSGVIVMDVERWLAQEWTAEGLILAAHGIAARSRDECSTFTKHISDVTGPPPPHGIVLQKRYAASSTGPSCVETNPEEHSFSSSGLASSCLPMEFRAWVLFGRLYAIESYTMCGSWSNTFLMYADGRGGWPECGPLSVDPVYYENCELSVDDQRLCRTALQPLLPEIQRWSEKLARSVGLDCLRTDWFVGGPDGLQLNEVSYGAMGSFQPIESLEDYMWSPYGSRGGEYRVSRVLRLAYANLGMGSADSAARILPRDRALEAVGCSETDHADLPILCH
mmetsp:Transcript_4405/g.12867  ORF Transcript_4405/g.12867 Transcript_4405/m.12867 type:complete len:486 (+) Transcript_4405:122-1579(+)